MTGPIGLGSVMAGCALARRGLIEQNLLARHGLERFVAQITFDLLMGSLQRKSRSGFVVERGRLPVLRSVAVRAIRRIA